MINLAFPKNDIVRFWLFFPNRDFGIIMAIGLNRRMVEGLFRGIMPEFFSSQIINGDLTPSKFGFNVLVLRI
jgi:hypothetical protein